MQNVAKLKQQQAMDERRTPQSNASEDLASTCRAGTASRSQRGARFCLTLGGDVSNPMLTYEYANNGRIGIAITPVKQ